MSVAPGGALARLSAAINRPKKRLLGLLKTENEFIGVVRENEFEIWERSQHAIHARGRVHARGGGTRIEMRFVLSTRARVLGALFFGLYVPLALSLALQPGETGQTALKLTAAVAGGLAIGLIFFAGAHRQRTNLRTFVEGLFGDIARL